MRIAGASDITIRSVHEGDLEALAAALAPDVSAQQLAQRWEDHQKGFRELLVATVGGQPVGTVSLRGRRYQRTGSLRMFALDVGSPFRSKGIGTSLIAAVENEARRRGLRGVHLEVAVNNASAVRLYERLGYESQGDAFVDRWWRVTDDSRRQQVKELSYALAKQL